MPTKIFFAALLVGSFFTNPLLAMDDMDEHGSQIFHAFRLEADMGTSNGNPISNWDFDGWIGGDENKLWLKSEGHRQSSTTEQAEFWGLYSRNVDTFWDAQIGLRYDDQPTSLAYLVLGLNGLAPYFFETEAHLFLSDDGDVTARLRQESDFLITQRLIVQPYLEANFSVQSVSERDLGEGVNDIEVGLQTRYEITRKFAPYVDVKYERKIGETSAIAKKHGEDKDSVAATIGLRLMF